MRRRAEEIDVSKKGNQVGTKARKKTKYTHDVTRIRFRLSK